MTLLDPEAIDRYITQDINETKKHYSCSIQHMNNIFCAKYKPLEWVPPSKQSLYK